MRNANAEGQAIDYATNSLINQRNQLMLSMNRIVFGGFCGDCLSTCALAIGC